ncbi:PREDICTED: transcription factor GHD7-like [Nelumbo nucifera]|uniref:Transcription factor GHD7-like n=1 Tax=Nelumbo nucifera TaxID=4432 RepID=A0A1U8AB01_NELNU|nr:PREDICTED: transcription factor GHD7-like [Nelumbo nucifera]
MTTSFPSSESCNACHGSAGTTSCGHASTFLSLLYMPQVANDHDSSQSAVTFSPAKHYKSGFDELSFFEHDDAVTWLHGSGPSPEKEPVTKYQESLHNNSGYLTLGVCSTTTSLSDSSHGSSPAEVSVFGKAASSATVVPSSRRMYLDASSGNTYSNDMGNSAASTGQGDNAAQREARILRYKEKKSKRRYEKQIRYAVRSANAEMKPRVKGRFAKNSNSTQPMPRP